MTTVEIVKILKELAESYTPVSLKSLLNMLLTCLCVDQIYLDYDSVFDEEQDGKKNCLIALSCGEFNVWISMCTQSEVYINQFYHFLYINDSYNINRKGEKIKLLVPKEHVDINKLMLEATELDNVYDRRILAKNSYSENDEDEDFDY